MAGRFPTTSEIRFSEKCRPSESGCIEWTGGTTPNGYGLFYADGQMRPAHRWIYEQTHGKLPAGIDCCHTCDNRLCVTLEHLFAGTRKENMEDAVRKGRTSRGKPRPSMQGANHHGAKLGEKDVLSIRDRHMHGETQRSLSVAFGVTYKTINLIVRQLSWSHL